MKIPKSFSMTPGQGTDPTRRFWNVVLENGVYIESPHQSDFLGKCFASLEANRLYTGEGWKEQVWHKVCEQNPHIPCKEDGEIPIVTGWADVRRFFITLTDLIGSGKPLVSPQVQEARIQKCLVCPKKVEGGHCGIGCGWLAQRLSELAGGCKIKNEENVHRRLCGACRCEISTKTAYPVDILKQVDERLDTQPEYWSECWMRHE